MSIVLRRAAFAASAFFVSHLALAADDTALEPVVSVATRAPTPLAEIAAPVVVIEREAIARAIAADLVDLLRFTAGVQVARNGGPGQTASVFLRGTESNHALVLLDGVELNPGTIGGAPLSAIPLTSIERVEIVFGPRSALYGSEAIGGVINIVTRRGGDAPALAATATVGGQGTRQASLSAGGATGAFDGQFDAERFATDGFRIQPAYPQARGNDRGTGTAALGWRAGTWDVRVRAFVSEGGQEYFDFFGTPVSQSFRDAVNSLTLRHDDGSWRSTLLLSSYSDALVQDQINGFTLVRDFLRTDRDAVDWQNDFGVGDHAFTLGAAWSDESTAAESFGLYRESTRVVAVYAQDRVRLGGHDFAFAARHTDHSTAGAQLSWNAEWSHPIGDGWRLTANAGEGFRAPDSADRYTPCCGNPDLRPERARHAELAAHWTPSAASALRVAVFETRIDDLISFGPSFVLENIDRARIRALEAGWRTAAAGWMLEARALVQDTEDLATGQPLPRRSDRTATVRATRALGDWTLGANLLGASGAKDSSFSTVRDAGYALLDLDAAWRSSSGLALRARLENAGDRAYVTADGYANPGRTLYLGVDWRL